MLLFAPLPFGLLSADDGSKGAKPSETGSVSGRIRYQADKDRPWRFGRYYIQDAAKGWLAEAVVSLELADGAGRPAGEAKAALHHVDQENFQFVPETIAIRKGDQIRFTNSDTSLHNVMLLKGADKFNVSIFQGEEHVQLFTEATGIEKPHSLGCVYHGSMRAWVFVFDHPWFAQTGKDGSFELKAIPAGRHRLVVRHPAGRLRYAREIETQPGQTLELEITLSPDDLIPLK